MDSSKDELTLLAASGQKVEHHIPGWKERRQLRWLEAMVRFTDVGKMRQCIGLLPATQAVDKRPVSFTLRGLLLSWPEAQSSVR